MCLHIKHFTSTSITTCRFSSSKTSRRTTLVDCLWTGVGGVCSPTAWQCQTLPTAVLACSNAKLDSGFHHWAALHTLPWISLLSSSFLEPSMTSPIPVRISVLLQTRPMHLYIPTKMLTEDCCRRLMLIVIHHSCFSH